MLRPSLRNLLQISSGKPIATVNITPHYCYININSPRPLPIPIITHLRHYSNHSNHHAHSDSCSHSHSHSHSNYNSPYSTTPISPHYIPTESELSSARTYLTALLAQHDHPSHVLTPFISPSARDAYLAIKSFNLNTASIADQTHSLALGRLRMAFWRDAIEDVFFPSTITSSNTSKPSYHKEPTILLLSHILSQPNPPRLNKGWFLRALSARESLLSQSPFPSLSQLETYAESTYSSITYLLLESQHIHSTALDHIAGHLGKAAGITAILRGVPITAFPSSTPTSSSSSLLTSSPFSSYAQGAVLLPLDICAKHSLSQEDVLRNGGNAHGLKDVVFEIATRANDHLLTARVMIKEARISKDLGFAGDWGVLLGALPTRNFLRRLEKVDFDVFDHSLERKDWRLPFHAYWAYKRGEF